MSTSPEPNSVELAERIDALCDDFEAAWKEGRNPQLESFLATIATADRPLAVVSLLRVEWELRRRLGEPVELESYRERFPAFMVQIEQAFAQAESVVDTSVSQAAQTVTIDTSRGTADDEEPMPAAVGRFEILGKIGEGAFGQVLKARDPQLDRLVAIKLPRRSTLANPDDRERFLREAKAAATMHHPNICPVYEVGTADGQPYIVMSLVPGKSLAEHIKQSQEPMPIRQAVLIVRKLAQALALAHGKGIIHRDLKPANILIDRERNDVVIMDFGLARMERHDEIGLTLSGTIMGTPAYMSPEQARGDQQAIGPATDVYSLGVILHELLTRQRPFEGSIGEVLGKILHVDAPGPAFARPEVDPRLDAIVRKCLAKSPGERYGSMKELAEALTSYLKERSSAASNRSSNSADDVLAAFSPEVKQPVEPQRSHDRAAAETAAKRARTPLRYGIALAALAAAMVACGIIFFARTPTATVLISIEVDLKDPELRFVLDDQSVPAADLAVPIELTVGRHELIVYRGAKRERRFVFHVKDGRKPGIVVKEDSGPPAPPGVAVEEDSRPAPPGIVVTSGKWMPLLRGEDPLKTWKVETKHSENRFEFSPGRLKFSGFVGLSLRIVANNYIVRARLKQAGGGVPKLGGHGVVGVGHNSVHVGSDGQVYLSKETVKGTDFKLLGKGRAELDEEGFIEVALAFYNGKMQVYSGGKLLIESDDDEYRGGHTSVTHFNPKGWNLGDGEIRDLEICVLDGTELTPQEALKLLTAPAAVDPAAERSFAQWVRDKHGELGIQTEDREYYYRHDSTEPLPADPFRVTSIRLSAQHSIQDADLAPLSGLTELKTVNLHHNPHFGPDALRPLRDLAKVETLLLFGDPGLGNAALEHILHLRGLKVLHIQRTGITDAGVKRIAGAFPELQELNLSQNDITDAAMEHVATFPELRRLVVSVSGVSDEGLVHLAGLELTELHLGMTKVTDAGLVHLKAIAGLEHLHFGHQEISDAGIEHLLALKGLKQLSVWNTNITEEGFRRLREGLPGCRIVTQQP